jgi:hypothetical protein
MNASLTSDVTVPMFRPRQPWPTLLAWLVTVVVAGLICSLIVVKLVRDEPSGGVDPVTQISDVVAANVAGVPESAFAAARATPVAMVDVLHGANDPLLTGVSPNGVRLPLVVFVGTESSMTSAAERWALVVALSRFGRFTKLGTVTSSATAWPPSLESFTFRSARYRSAYLAFAGYELTGEKADELGNYPTLTTLPSDIAALVRAHDTNGADLAAAPAGSTPEPAYPFVDLGGRAVLVGTQVPPSALININRFDLSNILAGPPRFKSLSILTAANELVVQLCVLTHQQPVAVCG